MRLLALFRNKSIKYATAFILLFIVVAYFFVSTSVFATIESLGQSRRNDMEWQAMSKLYYSSIVSCMGENKAYEQGGNGRWLNGASAANGAWFKDSHPTIYGAWLEILGNGGYRGDGGNDGDQKIYCGENGNALMRTALSHWDITSSMLGTE
jgi:hypothetical protein